VSLRIWGSEKPNKKGEKMISEHILKYSPYTLRKIRNCMIDVNYLARNLPIRGKVLDFGCGVGLLSYDIAKKRKNLKIVGVDNNQHLIDLANKYNKLENIEYKCAEISALGDEKFDAIVVVDVFHHIRLEERQAFFELLKKLLNPKGTVIISEPPPTSKFSYFMDTYVSKSWFKLVSSKDMIEMVARNGFKMMDFVGRDFYWIVHSYYMVLKLP